MAKKKQPVNPAPTPRRQAAAAAKPAAMPAVPALPGAVTLGLIAAALGVLLYIVTIGYNYTLDDFSSIKDNWVVKGGLKNIGIIFTTEYRFGSWNSVGSLYRPIPLTLFALQWQISPDNPMIGHIFNIIFYGLTGWVLWVTWRRVLAQYPPVMAAIAVLVFMALPVHVEVVANIKSIDEILSLLFATCGLYAIWRHLENDSTKWLVYAMIAYGLAMFSKESAITFLAIYPMTMWFFSGRSLSKTLSVAAYMLIPALVFLLVRYKVLAAQPYDEIFSPLDNFIVAAKNPGERYASAIMMCWEYLKVMVAPVSLVSDRGFPQMKPVSFSDWRAMLGLLLYAGMFIWALMNIAKKHVLSFSVLVYLAAFSLFSNVIIMIGTSYGERLLYLPSLGYAIAVGYIITKLLKIDDKTSLWNPNGKQALVWGITGVLVGALGIRTVMRCPAWQNSGTLYAADLAQSPNAAKLTYHNALEQVRIGLDEKTSAVLDTAQVMKGVAGYTRAIELFPEYHDAYGSRGLAYFRLGQFDKALSDYEVSLKYRYNDAKVLSNMGFIYFNRGQMDKAEDVYKKAVQYDPRFIDARRNLGAIFAMRKEFNKAIEQWQEGLKYDPKNATLLYYIGSAYRDSGQPDKAQPWLERAYAIEPSLRK